MSKKIKLFALLVLLMTAATGAWATTWTTLQVGDVIMLGDVVQPGNWNINSEYDFLSDYSYTLVRADVNGNEVTPSETGAYYLFRKGESTYLPDLKFAVTDKSDGLVVKDIYTGTTPNIYTLALHETGVAKSLITATSGTKMVTMNEALPYEKTIGEWYETVTGTSANIFAVNGDITSITSSDPDVVEIGTLNGVNTPVTIKAEGKATVTIQIDTYQVLININVPSPLYVALQGGTTDATKWTAKVGDGDFDTLPVGGLTGDGTETVTLKYSGNRQVKSITATVVEPAAAGAQLSDAFVDGNETVITVGSNILTLSATYNNNAFGAVTTDGTYATYVTSATMTKNGNNLEISVSGMFSGNITIDTANNTYTASGDLFSTLNITAITIGGQNIDPLPTKQ